VREEVYLLESLPEKYLALVEDSPVLAEDYLAGNHATGDHPDPICPDFPPSY
jgi:hypothetical protein